MSTKTGERRRRKERKNVAMSSTAVAVSPRLLHVSCNNITTQCLSESVATISPCNKVLSTFPKVNIERKEKHFMWLSIATIVASIFTGTFEPARESVAEQAGARHACWRRGAAAACARAARVSPHTRTV